MSDRDDRANGQYCHFCGALFFPANPATSACPECAREQCKVIAKEEAGEPQCECVNWARESIAYNLLGRGRDGLPFVTNHHPRCTHYNDSLIDVWKITDGSACCWADNLQDAVDIAGEEKVKVTQEKMHREVFNHLPEFEGF